MRVTIQAVGTATSVDATTTPSGEQHGVPDEPPRRWLSENLEGAAAARDPDDQVRERQQERCDDEARRKDERERGACPRSSPHVR